MEENPKNFLRFNDWQELLDYVETPMSDNDRALAKSALGQLADEQKAKEWNGNATLIQALEFAKLGWLEESEIVEKFSRPMLTKLGSKIEQQVIEYDVEGSQVDVARFLDGEPECWQRFETREIDQRGNRVIRIGVDVCASGGVDAEVIKRNGARIVTLIECLELAGLRVELTWIVRMSIDHSDKKAAFDCRAILKEPNQPLDLGRLMFAIGHPASLRQLGFALQDRCDIELLNRIRSGRGYVCETDLSAEYDIYFEGKHLTDRDWNNDAIVEAWLVEQLTKQGVDLGIAHND